VRPSRLEQHALRTAKYYVAFESDGFIGVCGGKLRYMPFNTNTRTACLKQRASEARLYSSTSCKLFVIFSVSKPQCRVARRGKRNAPPVFGAPALASDVRQAVNANSRTALQYINRFHACQTLLRPPAPSGHVSHRRLVSFCCFSK
jgi:hypothetical protein